MPTLKAMVKINTDSYELFWEICNTLQGVVPEAFRRSKVNKLTWDSKVIDNILILEQMIGKKWSMNSLDLKNGERARDCTARPYGPRPVTRPAPGPASRSQPGYVLWPVRPSNIGSVSQDSLMTILTTHSTHTFRLCNRQADHSFHLSPWYWS